MSSLNGLFSAKTTGTARKFKTMQGAFSKAGGNNPNPFTTKLRWVCGLCSVNCKDENGFKCHLARYAERTILRILMQHSTAVRST